MDTPVVDTPVVDTPVIDPRRRTPRRRHPGRRHPRHRHPRHRAPPSSRPGARGLRRARAAARDGAHRSPEPPTADPAIADPRAPAAPSAPALDLPDAPSTPRHAARSRAPRCTDLDQGDAGTRAPADPRRGSATPAIGRSPTASTSEQPTSTQPGCRRRALPELPDAPGAMATAPAVDPAADAVAVGGPGGERRPGSPHDHARRRWRVGRARLRRGRVGAAGRAERLPPRAPGPRAHAGRHDQPRHGRADARTARPEPPHRPPPAPGGRARSPGSSAALPAPAPTATPFA